MIPVTIFVTFIVLKLLGQSFNLMTLGGLAAAVGLVIDDAIVVVENIVLHRDAGEGKDRSHQERALGNHGSADRLHANAHRSVSAADLDDRREWNVLPRSGGDNVRCAADVAGSGADLDADAQPFPATPQGCCRGRIRRKAADVDQEIRKLMAAEEVVDERLLSGA